VLTARVLVVDGSAVTRSVVRDALERTGRFEVCGEAGDADTAVAWSLVRRPDIVVMELDLAGTPLAAVEQIASSGAAVVVLTASRRDADLFAAVRAGARGYLFKDIDPAALPRALDAVAAGEVAFPRAIVGRLLAEFRSWDRVTRRDGDPLGPLTGRERTVLRLMQEGRTTAEMARELFVSPVTIRTHVSAILHKLGVADRRAAVELVRPR
jgi:DNA-binding NarL/FixJ family response regulator